MKAIGRFEQLQASWEAHQRTVSNPHRVFGISLWRVSRLDVFALAYALYFARYFRLARSDCRRQSETKALVRANLVHVWDGGRDERRDLR